MVWPPLLRPGGLGGTRRKHRPGSRLVTKNLVCFRRRRRGAFPPSHSRKNRRLMIPSGPSRPPGQVFPQLLRPTSFQRAKVLPSFFSDSERFIPHSAICIPQLLLYDMSAETCPTAEFASPDTPAPRAGLNLASGSAVRKRHTRSLKGGERSRDRE